MRSKWARTRMRSYVSAVAPSIEACSSPRPLVTQSSARRAVRSVRLVLVLTRDPPGDGIGDHVEEAGVHHRLAQPLQLQLLEAGEPVDQAGEDIEVHEGRRAVGRPVLPELDRAHLAAQVALADGLDLEERGECQWSFAASCIGVQDRDIYQGSVWLLPSPRGRRWPEGPDEGSRSHQEPRPQAGGPSQSDPLIRPFGHLLPGGEGIEIRRRPRSGNRVEEEHAEFPGTVEPPRDREGRDQHRGRDHLGDVAREPRGPAEPTRAEPEGQARPEPRRRGQPRTADRELAIPAPMAATIA